MKRFLGFLLAVVLLSGSAAISHAQTTIMRPAVAFEEADRGILYIKQPDSAIQSYDIASIVTSLTGGIVTIDSIRQLSLIGMPPTGDRIIIGATVYYLDPSSTGRVKFQGLISVPWPLTQASFLQSSLKFMLPVGNFTNIASFRPAGVLSADGKEWWATLSSSSQGADSLKFYHGLTNGTGTIDSVTADVEMNSGFQMSNIALDTKTKTMLAMAYNGMLSTDQATDAHVFFYAWKPSTSAFNQLDFTGSYRAVPSHATQNTDSTFGLTVIPTNDGSTALIGLTPNTDNSILLYSVPFFGSTFNLLTNVDQISRGAIPETQNFFAGKNCGPYHESFADPSTTQAGNSGDIFANAIGGDSILFITHDAGDNCNDANTAVWYYDRSAGGSAQLVYNDPAAKELQPVWVVMPYTVPAVTHYPGIAWQTSYSGDFGTVDTGKTATLTFTAVDTSQVSVTINSAAISGANADEFTINPAFAPVTLTPNQTQDITVTFKPIAPTGSRAATLTVAFQGQSISSLTQALSGTSNVAVNTVKDDPAISASMTIEPNPFASITSVHLTAPDAGGLGIVVHDALGRTVYRSTVRQIGAGQTESFEFDAKSLGLTNGIYYVTAFLGDRQASRQVVLIR